MPPYLPTATAVTAAGTGVEPSGFGLSVAAATVGATRFGIGLRTDARAFRLQGAAVLGATTWKESLFGTRGLDTAAPGVPLLAFGPPAGGVVRPLARLPVGRSVHGDRSRTSAGTGAVGVHGVPPLAGQVLPGGPRDGCRGVAAVGTITARGGRADRNGYLR